MSDNEKSRNLRPLEYYYQIQKEFIVAELRRKIYPKPKDKQYYKRVMDGKKEKILKISRMHDTLPNIFNNDEEKEKVYKEIYGEYGIPNFLYKNEEHRANFEESDLLNYFALDADVKIISDGQHYIGRINEVNLRIEEVEIHLNDGQVQSFPFNQVKRIFINV